MGTWSAWDDPGYCWIVICKNKSFHRHTNLMFGHKIPLGETDAVSPMPAVIIGPFRVACDECGKEYSFGPEEVLKVEMALPESFKACPLFRDE
jgi:hypothetical protein